MNPIKLTAMEANENYLIRKMRILVDNGIVRGVLREW